MKHFYPVRNNLEIQSQADEERQSLWPYYEPFGIVGRYVNDKPYTVIIIIIFLKLVISSFLQQIKIAAYLYSFLQFSQFVTVFGYNSLKVF